MHLTLTHNFELESAHHLPNAPEGHKCRRVHGHNFVVEVHVTGAVDPEKGKKVKRRKAKRYRSE